MIFIIITSHQSLVIKWSFPEIDLLTCPITTENGYNSFWSNKKKFGNSDYSEDSSYFNTFKN